jgi:AbrB family looped-hinge helix DNA binding protein
METYATIKGQIVIPAALRRKYGITEGTKILIVDDGEDIILRPMTRERIARLRGSLKGTGVLNMLLDERHKDSEREDARRKGA